MLSGPATTKDAAGCGFARRLVISRRCGFDVGQRTLGVEAYVLPSPPSSREEVFRYCLSRNAGARRVHFALDRHGDLILTGRVPIGHLDGHEMELLLGEIYQLVELTFRRLVAVGFMREKSP